MGVDGAVAGGGQQQAAGRFGVEVLDDAAAVRAVDEDRGRLVDRAVARFSSPISDRF